MQNSSFVKLLCRILFALFSFVFLYSIEGELLSEAQFVYSGGQTRYDLFWGAIIITLLLVLIQKGVLMLLHFRDSYYSLSFFPSVVLLIVLTSLDKETISDFSLGYLKFLLPVVLCIFVALVFFLNKILKNENPTKIKNLSRSVCTNCIILLSYFLTIGSLANNNDIFLYELKTERLIIEGEYSDALEVGHKSIRASRRLSELRVFAMSQNGNLAEDLFKYSQFYGRDGILDVSDTLSKLYRFSSVDVCNALGAIPKRNISTENYLRQMFTLSIDEDSVSNNTICQSKYAGIEYVDTINGINRRMIQDYYLISLLMDKNISRFCEDLKLVRFDSLPSIYCEALALVSDSTVSIENMEMMKDTNLIPLLIDEKHNEYKKMKKSIPNDVERMNRLRREFGDTYWWYYDYSDCVTNPTY